MKKTCNTIYQVIKESAIMFFLTIVMLIMVGIVHEFGHCITSMVLKGKCEFIGMIIDNFEGSYLQMFTVCSAPDKIGWGIVLCAGSISALTTETLLTIYLYKKSPIENSRKIIAILACMFSEFSYWYLSYFIGRGDAYMLITLFDIDLMTFYLYLLLAYTVLIGFVITIGSLLRKKYKESLLYTH